MAQSKAELAGLSGAAGASAAIELRHLRYFTAVADAGSFTHAAEQMFIAQPTLSQQIRRLEQIVGTQLLQRRREGLRLTPAGAVLLDASRAVLSLVDHEVTRTRQAAGLGRPCRRLVLLPRLPDALAVQAASALRSAAAAADVEISWIEALLDAGFSLIRQRRADVGLGWLTDPPEALPAPLDVRRRPPRGSSDGAKDKHARIRAPQQPGSVACHSLRRFPRSGWPATATAPGARTPVNARADHEPTAGACCRAWVAIRPAPVRTRATIQPKRNPPT
jgi:DNA-binding transcriptional LysR family regulator